MSALVVPYPALSPTEPEVIEKLLEVQGKILQLEQVPIRTEHVIHAGIYSRTVTMPPSTVLVGAFIKRPTIVITVGSGRVLIGKDWAEIGGYQVLPASANRKQIFVSSGPLIITMIFPTSAKTVEEAEREFTDDHELLLSRRQDLNSVTITGE